MSETGYDTDWEEIWRRVRSYDMTRLADEPGRNDHAVEASIEVAHNLMNEIFAASLEAEDPKDGSEDRLSDVRAELQMWVEIAMLYMGIDHKGVLIERQGET